MYLPLYDAVQWLFGQPRWTLCAFTNTKFLQQLIQYTGYTQKNGAVSKVNKKRTSHLTRAQRTPSAAETVQVSHALPAVRFSCLMRGRGASFQDGVAAGKGSLCAPFWGVQICDYSARNSRCTVITPFFCVYPVHLWSYLLELFLECEMFHTKFVAKIKTHFMLSTFFCSKILPLRRQCVKLL